jgi:hypothetical protein
MRVIAHGDFAWAALDALWRMRLFESCGSPHAFVRATSIFLAQ